MGGMGPVQMENVALKKSIRPMADNKKKKS